MNSKNTDRVLIFYNIAVLIFVIIFHARVDGYRNHLLFNSSVVLMVMLLSYMGRRNSFVKTLSLWFPLLLFTFSYYQTGLLNRLLIPEFLDGFFMNLDVRIFGDFPGFVLNMGADNILASEYFHISYFSYYIIIPLTAFFIFRKDVESFEKFIFQLTVLFYLCCVIFIIFPVEGPLRFRDSYIPEGGLFKKVMDWIYAKGENPGAAFPSSHVAITFLVAWWGSRHFSRFSGLIWYVFISLSISTVYLMYHYAVDVVGGAMLGVFMLALFNILNGGGSHDEAIGGSSG